MNVYDNAGLVLHAAQEPITALRFIALLENPPRRLLITRKHNIILHMSKTTTAIAVALQVVHAAAGSCARTGRAECAGERLLSVPVCAHGVQVFVRQHMSWEYARPLTPLAAAFGCDAVLVGAGGKACRQGHVVAAAGYAG